MSDNPGIQWALELLAPDPNIKPTIVEKYTPDIIGIIFGSSVVSLKNWFARRPLSAGEYFLNTQNHIVNKHNTVTTTKLCKLIM